MSKLDEIHYIAERFLENYEAEQAQEFTTMSIERGMLQVILVRDKMPEYFCGFREGDTHRPVWAHDPKYAKSIDLAESDTYLFHWPEGYVFRIWNGVKH